MTSICFYFQVHQPYRVKRYRIFDIGQDSEYFNDSSECDLNNARILRKVAEKSYLPMNALLLELLERHPEFRFSFSFSGLALEQMEAYAPEVIESFQKLINTGRVEVLGETYYHSLAFFYDREEFEEQVKKHQDKVRDLFGITPRVFRNTELAYRDDLGEWVDRAGYLAVLAEGWPGILGWRSPNFVYRPPKTTHARLLLKNYQLSDDIAFRFGQRSWEGWPLTAEKFALWANSVHGNGDTLNLFMDYETFGEHQWADTGIFDFMRQLPTELMRHPDTSFATPSEVAERYPARDVVSAQSIVTWADLDRDLTAWVGNDMQYSAIEAIYAMKGEILATENTALKEVWRRLQTSDHFYYMCTKWFADGDVHAYFSPYQTPYEAFIAYMNALKDLRARACAQSTPLQKEINDILVT